MAISDNTDKLNQLIAKINSLPASDSAGGENGFSPIISIKDIDGGHIITITDINGAQSFTVLDGEDGDTPNFAVGQVTTLSAGSMATATITGTKENPVLNLGIPKGHDGSKGDGGVGIKSIVQTTTSTEDGGTNIITATLTDGKTTTFSIKNGSAGGRDGGNADTLENKSASFFAPMSTVNDLQGKVGAKSVSEQIQDAIANIELDSDNTELFHVSIYYRGGGNADCSHSASEIIEAAMSGKVIIVNGDFSYVLCGHNDQDDNICAYFEVSYTDGITIYKEYITIWDDKSCEVVYNDMAFTTRVVNVHDNIISVDPTTLNPGDTILYNNILHYPEGIDDYYFYFSNYAIYDNVKYMFLVSVDQDGNVTSNVTTEALIPIPEEADDGKVLVASGNGQVSWENSSGKTLSEHLAEEDMILSPRQYGDKLPGEDGEPYTHVPGRIFFKKKVAK